MNARKLFPLILPVLWLAVLGSAVQVIYARHKARDMFVRLEKLNSQRDSLDMEWGVASAKLQMNLPQTRDVRIVRP